MVKLVLDSGEIDAYDLFQDVNRTFGVSLEEADARSVETAGDLFRIVLTRLSEPLPPCIAPAAFRSVRRTLAAVFKVCDRRIRPGARLSEIIGCPAPEAWRHVCMLLDVSESKLSRSPRVRRWMLGLALGSAGIAGALATAAAQSDWSFPLVLPCSALGLALLAGGLTWAALVLFTRRLARQVPFATVGDLTSAALAGRFGQYTAGRWSGAQLDIWNRVTALIARNYGVRRPACIVPATRFVGPRSGLDKLLIVLGAR